MKPLDEKIALVDRPLLDRGRAVAALAREYGFTDVDGKQPEPLTLETA